MASVAKRRWTSPNGTKNEVWEVRYKDAGGRHRARSFQRKKEADTYARGVENELAAGTHIAPAQTLTLAKLIDEYVGVQEVRARRGERRMHGIAPMRRGLMHFGRVLGNVRLTDLTWQMVAAQVERLRETNVVYGTPKNSRVVGPKMAGSTVSNSLGRLIAALSWAARRGYVTRNVAIDARKEIGKIAQAPIDTFTVEEMKRVLAAIEAWYEDTSRKMPTRRTQAFIRAAVYLAAFCGMRLGEVLGLRIDRIDWTGRTILIDAGLSMADELGPTKTQSGRRVVPMPDPVADALRAYQPFLIENPRGLVFRTSRGTGPYSHGFYDKWRKLMVAAGIKRTSRGNRHFHALRHFAGSAWLDAGASLAEVSRLLGHANVEITARVYTHCIHDASQRVLAIDRCAAAFLPNLITHEVRTAA